MADETEELKALLAKFKEEFTEYFKFGENVNDFKKSLKERFDENTLMPYLRQYSRASFQVEMLFSQTDDSMLKHSNLKQKLTKLLNAIEEVKITETTANEELHSKILPMKAIYSNLRCLEYDENNFDTIAVQKKTAPTNEAIDALKSYVETAKIIRSSPDFQNSFAKKLENFLLDRSQNVNALLGDANVIPESTDFSKCFIRISAPNLDGKTQLAFLMEEIKPIYFMGNFLLASKTEGFPVFNDLHTNFEALSRTFLGTILNDGLSIYGINSRSANLSFDEKYFRVLGLLLEIVENAQYKPENQSWMEFYASMPDFSFHSSSLKYHKDDFKGFALFIEGPFIFDNEYSALIKNIAEAVNLPLIVIETTSDPGKLDCRKDLTYTENCVWSLNVTKLDPPCIEVLNQKCGLSDSIRKLTESKAQDDPVCKFFREFKIQDLRAGVACIVADAIKDFASDAASDFTLGQLLDFVTRKLSSKIKPRMSGKDATTFSQLSLFNEKAFAENNENTTHPTSGTHPARFINHFYEFKNPVDSKSNLFVAFTPDPNSEKIEEKYSSHRYLQYFHKSKGRMVEYTDPMSVFNQNEYLLMLGCMMVPLHSPMSHVCLSSYIESIRNSFCFIGTSTPPPFTHMSSYYFALITARASNYALVTETPEFTLQGIPGNQFLKNLILEMRFNHRCSKFSKGINVEVGPELNSSFAALRVPFIYRIGGKEMAFENYNSVESGLFVARYQTKKEFDLVDGGFNALKQNSLTLVKVASEVKNNLRYMTGKNLHRILRNFKADNAQFGLIYCSILTPSIIEGSDLMKYCDTHKINVYRVNVKNPLQESYSIAPFYVSCEEPEMICIAFEEY